MMFGGVFILTGVLHLYYIWKPFKKYLMERIQGQWQITRELAERLHPSPMDALKLMVGVWPAAAARESGE